MLIDFDLACIILTPIDFRNPLNILKLPLKSCIYLLILYNQNTKKHFFYNMLFGFVSNLTSLSHMWWGLTKEMFMSNFTACPLSFAALLHPWEGFLFVYSFVVLKISHVKVFFFFDKHSHSGLLCFIFANTEFLKLQIWVGFEICFLCQ